MPSASVRTIVDVESSMPKFKVQNQGQQNATKKHFAMQLTLISTLFTAYGFVTRGNSRYRTVERIAAISKISGKMPTEK
jgi:hypothetical protein